MRLAFQGWMGRLANWAGYPCVVRESNFRCNSLDVVVRVRASNLHTVVTVNGIDVNFSRLTGGIDGVSVSLNPAAEFPYPDAHLAGLPSEPQRA